MGRTVTEDQLASQNATGAAQGRHGGNGARAHDSRRGRSAGRRAKPRLTRPDLSNHGPRASPTTTGSTRRSCAPTPSSTFQGRHLCDRPGRCVRGTGERFHGGGCRARARHLPEARGCARTVDQRARLRQRDGNDPARRACRVQLSRAGRRHGDRHRRAGRQPLCRRQQSGRPACPASRSPSSASLPQTRTHRACWSPPRPWAPA